MKKYFFIIALVILVICLFPFQVQQKDYTAGSVSDALSSGNHPGFSRADKIRNFSFPQDDANHPNFQTEWWYYTGNVKTAEGRRFGYQFTIFRRAITPTTPNRKSHWATNQIYFAHFALSDIQQREFLHQEKFSRGAAGLAGVTENPLRIWIENWSIVHDKNNVHIHATTEKYAIAFDIKALKKRVLNGNKGLSQKSSKHGNASYYYSQTRLQTTGKITVGGKNFAVSGSSWLDREWSTSVLGKDQVGWDWFALQLSDNREVMLYQLRKKNGSIDSHSSGTFVHKNGEYEHLQNNDFTIKVIEHWISPKSGIRYPAAWKIKIPKYNLDLKITPHQKNQELHQNFTYWEGAVTIFGKDLSGNGYVEMTGYNKQR